MKKKILFAYDNILHYRLPLFNLLGEKYDFTVLHSGTQKSSESDSFKELVVQSNKIGPLIFQKEILNQVSKNEYDVIIFNFDVRWVNTLRAIVIAKKKARVVLWGAWLTDSKLANILRLYFLKRAESSLYYTEKSRMDFVNLGVPKDRTFVANNTFEIVNRCKSFTYENKFRILNVGSLNSRKQNNLLIQAFANIVDKIPKRIVLTIIGNGEEKEMLQNIVAKNNLLNRIIFINAINDSDILSKYYLESIFSVSFGQAGLSILQSFGFGVPYLTKQNAISGGEIYNIKDEINGLFCEDSIESLEQKMTKLCLNIDYSRYLGQNAYEYYSKYCTIENMYQGFVDAIENTNYSKIDKITDKV
ncbi:MULTISPECIES: glycosyltransferase family 4 protein [Flavobacteriaceae]|uniref:glycosyltransferase family 4 protein n=1 Tax=Flavobacteriaceae TaxID=49546 RepID=UPI00234A2578|nr:glycosyltransferase family 4 protein [Muricauda sp. SP22]MDC6362080.1 glycosyltransferase family 4 protein [Muricauda sp. SP22]